MRLGLKTIDALYKCQSQFWIMNQLLMSPVLRCPVRSVHWNLIGQERSRGLDTGLWLVRSVHRQSQSPGVYLPRKRRGRHKHSPRPDQETDKSSPSQSEASIQVTRSLSANKRPDQETDKVQPSQGRRRYTGLCWIVQLRPGNTVHMFLKPFSPSTLGLPSLVTLLVLAFVFLVSSLLSMIIKSL